MKLTWTWNYLEGERERNVEFCVGVLRDTSEQVEEGSRAVGETGDVGRSIYYAPTTVLIPTRGDVCFCEARVKRERVCVCVCVCVCEREREREKGNHNELAGHLTRMGIRMGRGIIIAEGPKCPTRTSWGAANAQSSQQSLVLPRRALSSACSTSACNVPLQDRWIDGGQWRARNCCRRCSMCRASCNMCLIIT
ncbi:hypothetical protein K504DRAFT_5308 [Pleomassaria siparia CBS 279.74]|uniref:Uncharacterized protein n=1 Tax=Pleomassaria siparia CBS 279.74 TaxID=1314801 RepID=A0A6G1KNX5_9PLEO|nr:hypothetical protein K504DRAFT_5308 [Pleomassaria siparia CBS 279.74]